jgi:hypothetical protein
VLRRHLTDDEDLHQLDLMVEEHRGLTAAIESVDAALTGGVGVTTAARELGEILGGHLDHEEQRVFPLLERHLSRQEWRRFLLTERRRRSPRERPGFLTWVLDDASGEDAAAVMTDRYLPGQSLVRHLRLPRPVPGLRQLRVDLRRLPSTSPAGRSELPALGATTVTQPVLFTAGEPDTATRLGSLDAVPAYVTRASQLAADPVPARGRTEPTLNCNS